MDMTTPIQLKPCWHCGKKTNVIMTTLRVKGKYKFRVYCLKCIKPFYLVGGPAEDKEEDAATRWNNLIR